MIDKLKEKLGEVKNNEPLSSHTTFKVGGPAKYFYLAQNSKDLVKAIKISEELGIKYFILGWGSNLIVSDDGFDGLVIKTISNICKVNREEVFVEAGFNLSRLVGIVTQNSLSGLEFASGIPGTVGGAARGNAGAYGKGFGDLITELEIYQDGQVKKISQSDMQYGYRDSILKHKEGVILSIKLKLKKSNQKEIQSEVVKNIKHRNTKLPFKPSAGCIFKNIDLADIKIDEEKVIKELDVSKEEWQQATKHGKLPTSYIMDKLNLKGKTIGGCQVSEKHAAFFINIGNCKTQHIMMLISDIKMRARNQLGIQLIEEVQYLGF